MKNIFLGLAFLASSGFAGSAMSSTVPITSPLFAGDDTLAAHSGLPNHFSVTDKVILGEKEILSVTTFEESGVIHFTGYSLYSDSSLHTLVASFVAQMGTLITDPLHPSNTTAWAVGSTGTTGLASGNYYLKISGDATNGGRFHSQYATSAVPVPAAIWLFGSALVGLVSVSRRKVAGLTA